MSKFVKILPYTVDLNETIKTTELHTIFVMGDKKAHRFEIEITRGNAPESLDGCTVVGKFINFKENTSVKISGNVEGSKAVVVLTDPCYVLRGQFVLLVQIHSGGPETTVFLGEGYMRNSSTDTIIHDDYVVMDVDALLDHIAAMESASSRANAAAARAESLAMDANGYAADTGKLGGKAPQYYASAQNLLDNSDFEVAQDGHVTMHGNYLYAADRWVMSGDGMEFSISGGVKTVSSSQGYCRVKQYLWNDGRDKGKTYTFVLTLADGSRVACCDTSPEEDNTEQIVVAQTDFGNGGSILIMKSKSGAFFVRIAAKQAGTSVSFLYADLYEGEYTAENAPPHVSKGYAAELAACRLHYRVIRNAIVQVSPNIQSYYRTSSIFYEPMRAEPSVTIAANTNGQYGLCANVGYITQESDITIVNRENGCLGLATTNEAFAGRALQVYKIMLDAEPR